MGTDKPLISILMAVYEPRMDWFREQLVSLNEQTYPNLRLYVRDDCSPTVPFAEIQSCIQDCISNFPVQIMRNEENLGSNGTFEHLTQEADGVYFAYCDQDDVWLPEKLEFLYHALTKKGAKLVCSDMLVINDTGTVIADSITKVRRRHVFMSGEGLAEHLLFFNFVTGCTMLLAASDAKAAIPFCPHYVHDQYLALFCAEQGYILSIAQPLICYRIHGGNQTLEMSGVKDHASYKQERIDVVVNRMRWLKRHFKCSESLQRTITLGLTWAEARSRNWEHRGGMYTIWKYRRFSPFISIFELIGAWFPNQILMFFVELKRKNKV